MTYEGLQCSCILSRKQLQLPFAIIFIAGFMFIIYQVYVDHNVKHLHHLYFEKYVPFNCDDEAQLKNI
jgi:hypothetical protein